MSEQQATEQPSVTTTGDMADHISEARQRARRAFAAEPHVGTVDDARQAIGRARDGAVLVWLLWIVLEVFAPGVPVAGVLVAAGAGIAVFLGLMAALAIRAQLAHYESELHRERSEILTDFEHERAEVRELYAAKGFQPPLLDQVVDTLCADNDRLLKVMMEEELGLFFQNLHHPVLVGLWNGAGALVGSLLLALPLLVLGAGAARWWMPGAGVVLLAALAFLHTRGVRRWFPTLVTWVFVAVVTGGLVFFLSQAIAGGSAA